MFKIIKYIKDFFHFYWGIVALQCVFLPYGKVKQVYIYIFFSKGFLGGTVVKNLPAHAGDSADSVLIPGSGRSSGVGNGNPL